VKESKFIELLNLYIDQQISPGEAALLEEEILNNPRHRRIYHQYCKMHRACTLVLENIRVRADQAPTGVEEVASRVVDFELRPRRSAWGYYAAGLAAAACVALVAVQVFWRPVPTPTHRNLAASPAPNSALPKTGLARTSAPVHLDATASPASRPAGSLNARQLLVFAPGSVQGKTPAIIVKSPAEHALPPSMLPVYATPMTLRPSIEQFVFEQSPAISSSPMIYRNRQPMDGQTEMTAFQFQR
jgi:hypothetical protein